MAADLPTAGHEEPLEYVGHQTQAPPVADEKVDRTQTDRVLHQQLVVGASVHSRPSRTRQSAGSGTEPRPSPARCEEEGQGGGCLGGREQSRGSENSRGPDCRTSTPVS
jgi:hypothetical protein